MRCVYDEAKNHFIKHVYSHYVTFLESNIAFFSAEKDWPMIGAQSCVHTLTTVNQHSVSIKEPPPIEVFCLAVKLVEPHWKFPYNNPQQFINALFSFFFIVNFLLMIFDCKSILALQGFIQGKTIDFIRPNPARLNWLSIA